MPQEQPEPGGRPDWVRSIDETQLGGDSVSSLAVDPPHFDYQEPREPWWHLFTRRASRSDQDGRLALQEHIAWLSSPAYAEHFLQELNDEQRWWLLHHLLEQEALLVAPTPGRHRAHRSEPAILRAIGPSRTKVAAGKEAATPDGAASAPECGHTDTRPDLQSVQREDKMSEKDEPRSTGERLQDLGVSDGEIARVLRDLSGRASEEDALDGIVIDPVEKLAELHLQADPSLGEWIGWSGSAWHMRDGTRDDTACHQALHSGGRLPDVTRHATTYGDVQLANKFWTADTADQNGELRVPPPTCFACKQVYLRLTEGPIDSSPVTDEEHPPVSDTLGVADISSQVPTGEQIPVAPIMPTAKSVREDTLDALGRELYYRDRADVETNGGVVVSWEDLDVTQRLLYHGDAEHLYDAVIDRGLLIRRDEPTESVAVNAVAPDAPDLVVVDRRVELVPDQDSWRVETVGHPLNARMVDGHLVINVLQHVGEGPLNHQRDILHIYSGDTPIPGGATYLFSAGIYHVFQED